MIYSNVAELIGNTPLLELTNYEKNHNLKAKVVAKIESFNPAGSAKDRIAKAMLETAEREGSSIRIPLLLSPPQAIQALHWQLWLQRVVTEPLLLCLKL